MLLQRTVFQRPSSYFHHYKDLSAEETEATARTIWREINLSNLQENIRPTQGACPPRRPQEPISRRE